MHNHNHQHSHQDFSKAFIIGILLNVSFITAEIIFGLQANSLALLSDAGHNIGDVLGLALSYVAVILSKKKSSAKFTYGLQSSTIIAALANAVILFIAVGAIAFEALHRLENTDVTVNSPTVIYVASFGILINGISAFLFLGGKRDLNVRSAFWHMASDALVSLGVVISGIVMLKTGLSLLDPIISLVIAAIIIISTWKLLVDSVKLALHAVPQEIDYGKVKDYLSNLDGVVEVHDLHIWALGTSEIALSAHLSMAKNPQENFLSEVEHELEHEFGINHSTIQIETSGADLACKLKHKH